MLEVEPSEPADQDSESNEEMAPEDTVNNNIEENKKSRKSGKEKCGPYPNDKRNQNRMIKAKVKCQITELKNKVFDCTGYKQAEDYKEAKEAVESYVLSHCKNGMDIRLTLEQMKMFEVPEPIMMAETKDDSDVTKAKKKRFIQKHVDAFV